MATRCDECAYFVYDDEYEEYTKYAHSSHLVAINSSVS